MTEGEKKFYFYQLGRSGSFMKKLFDAMIQADSDNLEKLSFGYREEAEAVYRYKFEDGYWQKLQDEWRKKWQS